MSLDKVIKGDLTNKYHNQFKIARDILDGIEKEKKIKKNKCDWSRKEDIAFYRSLITLTDRQRLLDRLCKNRKCCRCGVLKINPRSWVILYKNKPKDEIYSTRKEAIDAICRSCYYKIKTNREYDFNFNSYSRVMYISVGIFTFFGEIEERVEVVGHRIAQLREKIEISQRKFAKLCKWSKSYQFLLENGKFKTVSLFTAEVIMENIMKMVEVEWSKLVDVTFYRSNIKLPEIKDILDRLCPNRVCRLCDELKVGLKSWIINKNKTDAICRSCYYKNYISVKIEEYRLFGEVEFRFKVHGYRIAQLREKIEISQREFARQCGWSQSYHFCLENGKFKTVSQNVAETIIEVFGKHGIICKDVL